MWEEMYQWRTKFIFTADISKYTYSIRRGRGETDKDGNLMDELAYLICKFREQSLVIDNIFVMKNAPWYHEYENSHMGTNLMSDMLTDVYFRLGFHYTTVTGRLSAADSLGNWKNSIPFYRDFHNYLNPCLPFNLEFGLYKNKDYTDRIPDSVAAEEIMEIYKNQDLYFQYTQTTK